MSDDLKDRIVEAVRDSTRTLMAGYRSRDNEQHRTNNLLLAERMRVDHMQRALAELEEILEDRWGGPEDVNNGTLLAIVRRGLAV